MKHHDLDFLQAELTRVSDWVKFADAKAAFLAVFYSAILGLLVTNRDEVFRSIFWHHCISIGNLLMLLLLLGLVATGIYFLFMTVSPRLKNANTNRSLFYFGTVASMKVEDYLADIEKLTEEDARREVAEQIYTNSLIASAKMSYAKKSTYTLFLAGIVTFVLFFF